MRAFGTPPTWWLARPARCRKVAIERGEPSWQTSSTSPMSMPSSSEAVATSTFSSPFFRRCSAFRRSSFAILPWWAMTFSAPSSSDRWRAARSAMRRVLTKMSVVRCSRAIRASRAYTCCHTSVDMTAASGEDGTSIARSRGRMCPASTIAQSSCVSVATPGEPTRKRAMASTGFWVADSPTRTGGLSVNAASRSSDNARWLPRLFDASAWISSTMTVRVVASILRPDSEPSRM